MDNSENIRLQLRQIIREGVANILMNKVLDDGKINILHHNTLYGAPYSTKPYVLRHYADKKEEALKFDLKHLFNDSVIINREKKASEVIAYEKHTGKQIFTINLSSDRLRSSYIRFDCLDKKKIKIPVTISEEEIENIILGEKENIKAVGLNVFSDFYLQDVKNLSTEMIDDFYEGMEL